MSKEPSKKDDQPHQILDESNEPASEFEQEQNEAATELSNTTQTGQLNMDVKIHSPFKTYYEGAAYSLSGENATGPFDILPTHHNFITLLNPCELVVRTTKGDEKIQIGGGIMHVKANKVIVFLDV